VNTLISALVSLALLLAAVGLMVWHARAWGRARADRAADELDFQRRRFRRRMQTSAMLGLLAVALFVGELLTSRIQSPWFRLTYWSGVLLGVVWIGLLAAADVWASKYHYDRLRQSYLIEEAKLQAELRRIQAKRSNGKGS